MSSPILHIKDAYFFEVPRPLWPSRRERIEDFPDVWIRLDEQFQGWEAGRLHQGLADSLPQGVPGADSLLAEWRAWQHQPDNFGKPLDVMLEEEHAQVQSGLEQAAKAARREKTEPPTLDQYLADHPAKHEWFIRAMSDEGFAGRWWSVKQTAGDVAAFRSEGSPWSAAKIHNYNQHLSGKILIPQPLGTLRNLHEPESGFCISKFMIVLVGVAIVMIAVFSWLARRMRSGGPPRGRLWNFLEIFLVYIRDNIARPAIGAHDGDRYVPLLWTIFMFILICNLCGLLPWVGAPTSSFSVTSMLALAVFATTVASGMFRFGPFGFFKNMVPSMGLPSLLALPITILLVFIETLGLGIKHGVLAIRLLANMVAGHLVLLGIMGLAFGAVAAAQFAHAPGWQWWLTAAISVAGSVAFTFLELFVAFLQAFIFTFLSALFISTAIHHH